MRGHHVLPLIAAISSVCLGVTLLLVSCAPAPSIARTCGIIGDSIGVGLAGQLPNCTVDAAVGRHASQQRVVPDVDVLVISLGANDNPLRLDHLEELRLRTDAEVIWVVPPIARTQPIRGLADRYGDRVVTDPARADGDVHPSSYVGLARVVEPLL